MQIFGVYNFNDIKSNRNLFGMVYYDMGDSLFILPLGKRHGPGQLVRVYKKYLIPYYGVPFPMVRKIELVILLFLKILIIVSLSRFSR